MQVEYWVNVLIILSEKEFKRLWAWDLHDF